MTKQEISFLAQLSNYAGGRFDLVQAGGGNVSYKASDATLWVKASGTALAEVTSEAQLAQLKIADLLATLKNPALTSAIDKSDMEKLANSALKSANLTPDKRPSIETFLHALLYRYTLHTHPLVVNNVVICQEALSLLSRLFPDALFVEYATPGIELALRLHEKIEAFVATQGVMPQIVFLKNHGLIISADDPKTVIDLTEQTVLQLERAFGIDYQRYRLTTALAHLLTEATGQRNIAFLCEDREIMRIYQQMPKLLQVAPTSPDAFVFNGFAPLHLPSLDVEAVRHYHAQYGLYPKVLIYQDQIFFTHQNPRKAKEMEEVFKFHLLALQYAQGHIETLPESELRYLAGWEAEKYRQQL